VEEAEERADDDGDDDDCNDDDEGDDSNMVSCITLQSLKFTRIAFAFLHHSGISKMSVEAEEAATEAEASLVCMF
tara:strand:- start:716 stop:940 length:225 start_codon:yes stop_codon:yes gene_type:complete